MFFDAKEMEVICVFHSGTLSGTIEAMREAAAMHSSDKKDLLAAAIDKLSGMKPGETVSLAFDPE